jgi:hypothetical protein
MHTQLQNTIHSQGASPFNNQDCFADFDPWFAGKFAVSLKSFFLKALLSSFDTITDEVA